MSRGTVSLALHYPPSDANHLFHQTCLATRARRWRRSAGLGWHVLEPGGHGRNLSGAGARRRLAISPHRRGAIRVCLGGLAQELASYQKGPATGTHCTVYCQTLAGALIGKRRELCWRLTRCIRFHARDREGRFPRSRSRTKRVVSEGDIPTSFVSERPAAILPWTASSWTRQRSTHPASAPI